MNGITRTRRLANAYTELAAAEDRLIELKEACHRHMVAPTEMHVAQLRFGETGGCAVLASRIPDFVAKNWLDFISFSIHVSEVDVQRRKSAVAMIEAEIEK